MIVVVRVDFSGVVCLGQGLGQVVVRLSVAVSLMAVVDRAIVGDDDGDSVGSAVERIVGDVGFDRRDDLDFEVVWVMDETFGSAYGTVQRECPSVDGNNSIPCWFGIQFLVMMVLFGRWSKYRNVAIVGVSWF